MSAVKREAKQSSISALFAKASAPSEKKSEVEVTKKAPVIQTASKVVVSEAVAAYEPLKSSDPLIQEFYNQLSPAEVIAHSIAVEKLGTSYDVSRTHGFLKWSRGKAK